MENRRFPYGYGMINGCIQICKTELEIPNQVFNSYIKGKNLKNMAELLTKERVEYLPGEYGWNKSRIKRIIEDKRYLGDSIYPQLISEEIYFKANVIKTERRTTKDCIIYGDSKLIVSAVHCAE